MQNINSLQSEALKLTERYFDGHTTLAEERRLRQLLANPQLMGAELDEARAVLGYVAVTPAQSARKPIVMPWRTVVSVAASVALVVILGVAFFVKKEAYGALECIAYVDGERIENPDHVVEIMQSELSLMGEASAEVHEDIATELNAFSEVMNQSNNEKL